MDWRKDDSIEIDSEEVDETRNCMHGFCSEYIIYGN